MNHNKLTKSISICLFQIKNPFFNFDVRLTEHNFK